MSKLTVSQLQDQAFRRSIRNDYDLLLKKRNTSKLKIVPFASVKWDNLSKVVNHANGDKTLSVGVNKYLLRT